MTAGEGKPKVAAVPDRTVWFKHAKFNHASHRGATCASCHPGIKEKGEYVSPVEADKPEPVQIVGVDTCRTCHSPAGTEVKFKSAKELAKFLADSEETQYAFAQQAFHYFVKQPVRAYGLTKPDELRKTFADNALNMRKLIVEIAVLGATPATERTPGK